MTKFAINRRLRSSFRTLFGLAAAAGLFFGDAHGLDLTRSVIGSGGGKTTGGTYVASTTISQPIVGTVTGGSYTIDAGFWNLPDPAISGVDPEVTVPDRFALGALDSNPFTSSVAVSYALPNPVSRLRISLFDASGRRVRSLIDGPQEAGNFSVVWDGEDDRGSPVSSGVYFCQMVTGKFRRTLKMVAAR